MSAAAVDTLILPGWVVPAAPEGGVLEGWGVGIAGNKIAGVYPPEELGGVAAAERVELPGHAVLPGLINMHGHAAMCLMRGFADDLPLKEWLEGRVWPAEARVVSADYVRDGTRLAIAEMLRGGTTCFSDMYFFPDAAARCAQEAGMRCQIAFPVLEFPSAWAVGAEEYISKGLALRDDLKDSALVTVAFGPHAPYTVEDDALRKIAMYANEVDAAVQIHLHETAAEVRDAVQASGKRPVARLRDLGLLGPRVQCVHTAVLNRADIDMLATAGAHVIHCPESNMKLASGRCPVSELQAAGVNVALGTDGAASNNDLSMLGEARAAALLAKLGGDDAAALPAARALSMATMNGAIALGMQDELGSLEAGKLADVIAVDLSAPELQPVYNPVSHLIYAAGAGHVTHSWIDGKAVLRERELLGMDVAAICERARHWREQLANG